MMIDTFGKYRHQKNHFRQYQGCDLEVGQLMYPKIPTLMSKNLKTMYTFKKLCNKKRIITTLFGFGTKDRI